MHGSWFHSYGEIITNHLPVILIIQQTMQCHTWGKKIMYLYLTKGNELSSVQNMYNFALESQKQTHLA